MYVAFRFGGRRGYNYDIQLLNTCFAGHTLCMCCVCQIVCNNLLGVFLCISDYMFWTREYSCTLTALNAHCYQTQLAISMFARWMTNHYYVISEFRATP